MTIVKVQRPLNGPAPWVIYDRGRTRESYQVPTREMLRGLKADPKGYFEGEWDDGSETWKIGRRVEAQPW